MRIDRSFLGWGIFFLLVGAIPLAVRGGYLSAAQMTDLWRFWPLLLVIAGLSILLRKTPLDGLGGLLTAGLFGVLGGGLLTGGIGGIGAVPGAFCGGEGDERFATRSGDLTGTVVEIDVELACGDLTLTTIAGSGWSVDGEDAEGLGPVALGNADDLSVRPGEHDGGPFGWARGGGTWRIAIPTDPTLDLGVEINAGHATFDLARARLGRVSLEVNAGSVTLDMGSATTMAELDIQANAGSIGVTLPAATFNGRIEVNAGSVGLCVPPDVGLKIETASNPIASYDFDGHGLIHDGSLWITPGFETASVRIGLDVEANAGSIELDPKEGCGG